MKRVSIGFLFCYKIFISSIDASTEKEIGTAPPDSVVFAAGKHYKAGSVKSFFWGKHYRKEWCTMVKAPVFDMHKGGLKILKQGGSRQTINLRFSDSTGREFVLRSIDKVPQKILPPPWRNTFLANIVQDQMSAGHPYGAFTIPLIASAVGVFHTNPVLVYVQPSTDLGEYTGVLSDQPALWEERPAGTAYQYMQSFGQPQNIIGTDEMKENVWMNQTHHIDDRLYARSRMLDMLIGDWSRHEDQWRWGVFPKENTTVYKPIPRDRDHVYFRFRGFFPGIISQRWAVRHLKHYGYKIRDVKGLNKSARHIDHFILSRLSKNDWVSIADSIQKALTDDLIELAIKQMPEPVFKISGYEIIDKLRSRKNQLPVAAEKYYYLLAKRPRIYARAQREFVEIISAKKKVEISIYSAQEKIPSYKRVFSSKETREIKLHGFDQQDQVVMTGKRRSKIKITFVKDQNR